LSEQVLSSKIPFYIIMGRKDMKSAMMAFLAGMLVFIGAAIALPQNATLEHGREVYAAQKCALCHSISGIGGKKHALDGVGSRLKQEEVKKWIRTPKEMKADTTMKPYPDLPDKDLNDLAAYLMTLKQ
jgi:mono/diheme cytochrome c family protein